MLEVLLGNLQDRWQKVKINTTFSFWAHFFQGVSQESVFVPILFNIYTNDTFFALKGTDICNFADGLTQYVRDLNLNSAIETLEHKSDLATTWFKMNYIRLKTDKSVGDLGF